MVKIYDDIELIQFPRSNEKITPMLCFDDCIATFCNYINVVYEKAYINALELDFNWCELKGIGKSYNYGTKLEDNLKQYCGIEIKSRKCDDKDKVTQIVECIDNNILVCVEVLGFNCPWDWRYQIVPQGAHYFFINGYDESKCCFNCLDPFYDVINGSISFDDLKNGMQSYDIFQIIEFEEKNQDIKELLNAISSFFDSDQFDKYYIFSQKFKTFDLNKEIENYNSEMELNVDEVENDIPLNYVFKDIIHNRLRFGEYLRRIAERNEKYSASLIEFANKYISFSQKWESTRLMLIKFLIVNRLDRITGNLAEKLELIITEEKDTLNDLLSMLKGQYEENNKLEIQIEYMLKNKVYMTYTQYSYITENGSFIKDIEIPKSLNYKQALKGNKIGCLTVVIDKEKIGKIQMPNLKHEDYATWLNILKKGITAYGIPKNLAQYRKVSDSLSANKLKTIAWTWNIFRKSQKLNRTKSLYFLICHLKQALKKHNL